MSGLLLPFHSSFLGDGDNFHRECLRILECRVMEQQLVKHTSHRLEEKKILLDES